VLLSHDVFSYVDYARLGVRHGLDPYVTRPDAVPSDPAFARVTWTHTRTVYGPLFTLATYPLAWLSVGAAVAVLKAVAALSVLGLAALVARIAAWRGLEPLRAAAFVALNPLVLVHVVGGAHNDGLTMLLAMLGVAAVLVRREAADREELDAFTAAVKTTMDELGEVILEPKPGGKQGDLFAIAQIAVPTAASERERDLFRQLAQDSTFNPRGHFNVEV